MSTSMDLDILWDDNSSSPIVLDVNKLKEQQILNKINNPKNVQKTTEKILKSKNVSYEEKLILIEEEVMRVLGHYKPNTLIIHSRDELTRYIDKAIENGIIAIDTETNNSLDPITCLIMGGCIYTPDEKNCYIPVNHRDFRTKVRLDWQVTEQDVREELNRLLDANVYMIWHNGKFDYQVFKCTCGVCVKIDWDTMIAARMLDENELSAGLKQQYIDKIDKEQEKYDIEGLFKGVEYADVNPDVFALYAATDAYMTYKLYEWQKNRLESLAGPYRLYKDIELPLIIPVAEMELTGVMFDLEYADRLHKKYSKLLDDYNVKIEKELELYKDTIAQWRLTPDANKKEKKVNNKGKVTFGKSKNEQFEEPYNLESATQLAIFLYDILKIEPVNKEKPRSTDKDTRDEILELHKDLTILKLLDERRTINTLMSDFIIKLPQLVNPKTGAIHCHFNQLGKEEKGVVTGRFSSSDPNLQQIPSHNKEVRMLFTARPGCKLIGGDFSAQEPRLTAYYSQDENMLQAYKEGKDLYSVIASISFGVPYEDCLEFYPEGTKIVIDGKEIVCGKKTHQNKDGKERRSQAKSILLGIIYGRGPASIAIQIEKTREEAQEIIDKFFKAFPKVKTLIEEKQKQAKTVGWVEDWYGRRRRLPDLKLPKYDIQIAGNKEENSNFNPFLICSDRVNTKSINQIKEYQKRLAEAKYKKDIDAIKEEVKKNGFTIHDNSGFIAKSERQTINSIVQGGAATLTKLAMLNLYNDEEMRRLGFHMLIPVHDEILGECPEENADRCEERLVEIMTTCAAPYLNVPMACDTYNVKSWYEDEYAETIIKQYKNYIEGNVKKNIQPMTSEEAMEKILEEHTEQPKEYILKIFETFKK